MEYTLNPLFQMDTLPHTRVMEHLSRYSLAPGSGNRITSAEKGRFYLIVQIDPSEASKSRINPNSLVDLAKSFGAEGVVYVDSANGQGEQKEGENDGMRFDKNAPHKNYLVSDMAKALVLLKDTLGVTDIIGITTNAGVRGSVSVGHPKAFSRSVAFVCVEDDNAITSLTCICDRFVHVQPFGSLARLPIESCASIAFFKFAETMMTNQSQPACQNRSVETEMLPLKARRGQSFSSTTTSSTVTATSSPMCLSPKTLPCRISSPNSMESS